VALYHGEADEFRGFRDRFGSGSAQLVGDHARQKRLTFFTSGTRKSVDVPSVVAAPATFRGELGLGGLMQTVGAFNRSRTP